MIVTSNRPPGRTYDAEKDRTARCDVASTGAGCTSPINHRADAATANSANAFVTSALSLLPAPALHAPAPSNQPAK